MHVPTVRDSLAVLADAGQNVTLDQRDSLVMVGEHACGEQPGHASAKDSGMIHRRVAG